VALNLGDTATEVEFPSGVFDGTISLSSYGDREGEKVTQLDLRANEGLIIALAPDATI
jgi:hypothetical protein